MQTPTLGSKDQPAQHEEPQQQQQQHEQHQHQPAATSFGNKQQQHLASAGQQSAGHARHRLANISNIPPPSPAPGGAALGSAGDGSPQRPDSSCGLQAMATGGTTGRAKHRQHVFFQPGRQMCTGSCRSGQICVWSSWPPPAWLLLLLPHFVLVLASAGSQQRLHLMCFALWCRASLPLWLCVCNRIGVTTVQPPGPFLWLPVGSQST